MRISPALLCLVSCSMLAPTAFGLGRCSAPALVEDPLDGVQALETKHYIVLMAGDPSVREDYGRFAEAAWDAFHAELKIKPRSARRGKTTLKLYANREAWEAGTTHEQVFTLPGHDFVHYEPERETIYVYGDPRDYYTRKMLMYGLFRQYHLRTKSKNYALASEWYVTGMADTFSTHEWNDGRLQVMARRLLGTENRAYLAVQRGALLKVADGEFSQEDLSDWDVRWALTAFLMRGEKGTYRTAFQKLALGDKGSMLTGLDFLSNLGDPKQIAVQLTAWLKEESRCLQVVCGEWQYREGVLSGKTTKDTDYAFTLSDDSWKRVHVTIPSGDGNGGDVSEALGLVLDWQGPEDCVLALRQGYDLRVVQCTDGKFTELDMYEIELDRGQPPQLSAILENDEVTLRDGERVLGTYESMGRRLGLVIYDGAGSFEKFISD